MSCMWKAREAWEQGEERWEAGPGFRDCLHRLLCCGSAKMMWLDPGSQGRRGGVRDGVQR